MIANKTKITADIGSYSEAGENSTDYPVFNSNAINVGSQVKEPIILGGNNSGANMPKPNTNDTASATTNSTKNYVGGGTTPDSNIVVNKPKPNYLRLWLLGIVGAFVVYKVFFSKKRE